MPLPNLYATPEEIGTYISSNFFGDSKEVKFWGSLSEDDKSVFANRMTSFLESLPFVGQKYQAFQPLALPRYYKGTILRFNDELLSAAIQSTIYQIQTSQSDYTELIGAGVKTYSVEGSSIGFQSTSDMEASSKSWVSRVPQSMVSVFSKYCY